MLQLQQGLNVVADGSIKDEIIVMQMNDTLLPLSVSLFPPTLMLLQLVSYTPTKHVLVGSPTLL